MNINNFPNSKFQNLIGIPKSILRYLIDLTYPYIHKRILHLHRVFIAENLFNNFGGKIAYGPFHGLRISQNIKSVSPDFPSMYFGIYEQEVLNTIQNRPQKYTNFINLGAGDGYYSIGVLFNGLFESSIAFEESPIRQKMIVELAMANKVDDRIEVLGRADYFSIQELPAELLAKSMILIDVEGGEFEILNLETIKLLKNSIVIVEIHDFLTNDGEEKLTNLKSNLIPYFNITSFTTSARDLSKFTELYDYSDVNRWFVCIEGRGKLMNWWRLDPKNI